MPKEEQKIVKNGSFSSNFLKSRNLFNLRLSTDFGSRLTFDGTSPLPKKSPITPYSRQTSSSDSQKSANSIQPPLSDWESGTPNGVSHRTRRNSISSCYSITEKSPAMANEMFSMNQSELNTFLHDLLLALHCFQIIANRLFLDGLRFQLTMTNHKTRWFALCCVPVIYRRWIRKDFQILFAKWISLLRITPCDTRDGKSRESLIKQTIPSSTKPSLSWAWASKIWLRLHCLLCCWTTINMEMIFWGQRKYPSAW